MFNKKTCKRCNEKIKDSYGFCPSCGTPTGNQENWGMLGKNDSTEEQEPFQDSFLSGITGTMLNKMLGSAFKMLEKEMQKDAKRMPRENLPASNFRLSINGKEIPLNNQEQAQKQIRKKPIQFPKSIFSTEQLKKISKLPRKEPKIEIKRFSDRVVYEIKMPGVKSTNDIMFIKLENSIEIKAIAKDKVYVKTIQINLPLINYTLKKDNLILEFANRG